VEDPARVIDPSTDPSLGATSPSGGVAVASDTFLLGDFIELGIAEQGSLGSQGISQGGASTPNAISVIFDTVGFAANTPAARSGDFFNPGSPVEGYVIGLKIAGGAQNFVQDRGSSSNQINAATVETSTGSTLSAETTATFSASSSSAVTFKQVISFDQDDSFFKTTVTIQNSGSVLLEDVRYMRTMDPDQDQETFGTFATQNDVLSQPSGNNVTAIAHAKGPTSQNSVNLISTDGSARASNFGFSNTDAFAASAFNTPVDRGGTQVDEAITLTLDFGDIAAGASVTKTFFTSFQNGTSSNSAANDMIVGTDNADSISTGDGNDTIFDLGGNDTVSAGDGNDTIIAGVGNDTYNGENGNDTLDYRNSNAITADFGSGNVTISGSAETDSFSNIEGITGSSSADSITGGSNAETLTGSGGADTLRGNGGADTFAYVLTSDGDVRTSNGTVGSNSGDTVADFVSGTDKISLSKAGFDFTTVSNGVNFEVINAGFDGTNSTLGEFSSSNPVLIYSKSDEALIYDDNGSSAGYTILLNHGNASASNDIVATDIVLV
jgi:Ca2+-binding RTX toxin-like protein